MSLMATAPSTSLQEEPTGERVAVTLAGHGVRKDVYKRQLLSRETDGAHGLTVPQIIEALAARGIAAERKSIYTEMCIRDRSDSIVKSILPTRIAPGRKAQLKI